MIGEGGNGSKPGTKPRRKNIIKKHDFIIIIGLQLTSIIPFSLINAAAVASGVPWKKFIKATSIGICPGILLYSFMGNKFVANMVSPRVYFAGVFVMALLLVVTALRKKKNQWDAVRSRQHP